MWSPSCSPVEEEEDGGQWVASYQRAAQLGREGANCQLTFPTCPVSVLDIFKFGKKGKPEKGYDKSKKKEDSFDDDNTLPVP